MSLPSALLAALIATSAPVPNTCSPDPPGTFTEAGGEAYIRGAETDWAASIAQNEAAFLRRVAATNFTAVFDGEVLSRAALIAGAEKRRPGAASDTLKTLRVHLYGSTAVAEGSEIWSETASGHPKRIVWSDLWVHCGGEWCLVTATAIESPAN